MNLRQLKTHLLLREKDIEDISVYKGEGVDGFYPFKYHKIVIMVIDKR